MIAGLIRAALGAAFDALRGYLGDLRAEQNLKRLGVTEAELERRGVSAAARRAARKRGEDVTFLDLQQVIGVNRAGAAALDVGAAGVRDAGGGDKG